MPSFRCTVPIRFRDVDALGHVNNAVFLTYCEVARQEYFRSAFGIQNARDFEFILARFEVDYLLPLELTVAFVEVSLSVPRIGKSSWDFGYEVIAAEGGAAYCRARSVQVCYDYERQQSRVLPAEWHEKLAALSPESNP